MRVPSRRRLTRTAAVLSVTAFLATFAAAGDERAAGTVAREIPLVELGRRLFFDPAASSRSSMRSCADCHDPDHGFADRERQSVDDTQLTRRHSQSLIDGGDSDSGHWDGEFESIRDLAQRRIDVTFDSEGNASYASGGSFSVSSVPSVGTTLTMRQVFEDDGSISSVAFAQRMISMSGLGHEPAVIEDANAPSHDDGLPGLLFFDDANGMQVLHEVVADAGEAEIVVTDGVGAFEGGALVDVPMPSVPVPAPLHGFFPVVEIPTKAETSFVGFVNPKLASTLPTAMHTIAASARYREAFLAATGAHEPRHDTVARAIGQYCHSIRSGDSPFDRHLRGEANAMSESARRGWDLFRGAGRCASCHTTAPRSPGLLETMFGGRMDFSDDEFHNTGVSLRTTPPRQQAGGPEPDPGRFERTGNEDHRRAFKTPSLRDVARHAPYMHDGSLATLEDVVRHYASPVDDPRLDAKLPRAFRPTDADVADLVAFLHALTSDRRPGLAASAWSARAPETRLRFVDARGRRIAGLRVALEPAGDVVPDVEPLAAGSLTTDADGALAFRPGATTHTRLVLDGGLVPEGGSFVPDTCRWATVVLPIDGAATAQVLLDSEADAPATLEVAHPDAVRLHGRRVPRTTLRRVATRPLPDGGVVATYEAPYRTDVGDRGEAEMRLGDRTVVVPLALDAVATSIVTLRDAPRTDR